MTIARTRTLILALMVAALAACASGPSSPRPPGGDRDDGERPTPSRPVFEY